MKIFSFALLFIFLIGCEKKDPNALPSMHWDRDMCQRCVMVVSDRKNAAMVVDPITHKEYKFDDIGCVVLWFEEEKIAWKESAKIWVTDRKTGEWIDARSAVYDTVTITPMAYGLGAYKNKEDIAKGDEVLDYAQMYERILFIEKEKNVKRYK